MTCRAAARSTDENAHNGWRRVANRYLLDVLLLHGAGYGVVIDPRRPVLARRPQGNVKIA